MHYHISAKVLILRDFWECEFNPALPFVQAPEPSVPCLCHRHQTPEGSDKTHAVRFQQHKAQDPLKGEAVGGLPLRQPFAVAHGALRAWTPSCLWSCRTFHCHLKVALSAVGKSCFHFVW